MKSGFNATCFISLTIVLILGNIARGQDTTVVESSCDENTWGDNDVYAQLVSDVLDAVVRGVPVNEEYLDYSMASSGEDVAYGRGTCDAYISTEECTNCIEAARDQLKNTCGNAVGGTMILVHCEIRYENYDFLYRY